MKASQSEPRTFKVLRAQGVASLDILAQPRTVAFKNAKGGFADLKPLEIRQRAASAATRLQKALLA